MMLQGNAEAFKTIASGEMFPIYFYDQGDWFGELAVMEGIRRMASIEITSEFAVLLALDIHIINRFKAQFDDAFREKSYTYITS
jgi:CRP-like cAMP-binding protein